MWALAVSLKYRAVALSDYPIRPHSEWLTLGFNPGKRRRCYAELVAEGLLSDEIEVIRRCARKGLPAGSDRFKLQIEGALARRIGDGRQGRPRKGL